MTSNHSALFVELTFGSFYELMNYIFNIKYQFFYRGVSNYDYKLESKLQRFFKENGHSSEGWVFKEMDSINFFKRSFKSVSSRFPANENM